MHVILATQAFKHYLFAMSFSNIIAYPGERKPIMLNVVRQVEQLLNDVLVSDYTFFLLIFDEIIFNYLIKFCCALFSFHATSNIF